MNTAQHFLFLSIFVFLFTPPSWANHRFGVEFELAVHGEPSLDEVARNILLETHKTLGGNENNFQIIKEKWERSPKNEALYHYTYTDVHGRMWEVAPEVVNSPIYDGLEFITPPLERKDLPELQEIVKSVKRLKSLKRGTLSSGHITLEVSHLIHGTSYNQVTNLILYLESHWPELYSYISPKRLGHMVNFYSVPLALDQRELLEELSTLPAGRRSFRDIQALFQKYESEEIDLRGLDGFPWYPWKFRAANYAKLFSLHNNKRIPVIEFRATDLDLSPRLNEKISMLLNLFERDYSKPIAFEDRFKKTMRWFEGEAAMIEHFSEKKFKDLAARMNMSPETEKDIVQTMKDRKTKQMTIQQWHAFNDENIPKELSFDITIKFSKASFKKIADKGILNRWPDLTRNQYELHLTTPASLEELVRMNDVLIKPFENGIKYINLSLHDSRQSTTFPQAEESAIKWILADAAVSSAQMAEGAHYFSHEQTKKIQSSHLTIHGNYHQVVSFILGLCAHQARPSDFKAPVIKKKYSLVSLLETYARANNLMPLRHHEKSFLSQIERSFPEEFLMPLSNLADGHELTPSERKRIQKATQEFASEIYQDITGIPPQDLDLKNGQSFVRHLNAIWREETDHSKLIERKFILQQQPHGFKCENIFTLSGG